MGSVDKGLVQKLQEAGNRLAQLPTDVDELLPLLDHVESLLSRVEQSPPELIQKAYSPSMKALLEEPLLRHSDVDVKVAIASCISEITRITAPEAPYNDEQMKDVFQLIVSSFENLSDKSSRSYDKRASILETVAKVRSCVVMLDLECDSLIVEMFQHFLNSIRDYHPENVFACMETIMTLVLEESEDVSLELLTPILASLRKDNEEIPTIARKLGERVFEKCAVKIKPYVTQAVKSLGVPLDDYSKVVASICEGRADSVENTDVDVSGELAEERKLASSEEAAQFDESKFIMASIDETAQEVKEHVTEEAHLEVVHPEAERSPKSVMSNGITETGNEGTSVVPESLKKPDESNFTIKSLDVNITNKMDTDDSDAGKSKSAKSESKAEQTAKIKGRKSSSILNSTEPSDPSHVDEDKEAEISCPKTSEKEAEKSSDPRKSDSKDTHASSGEDQNVDTGASSENEKVLTAKISSPKALDSEVAVVASVSPSKSLPDENLPRKAGEPKKKENLSQEDASSVDPVPAKVAADGTSDSEAKPQRHSGKKKETLAQAVAPHADPVPEKGTDVASDSEVKRQRRSGKKRENLPQEVAPSVDPVPAKVADRTSDSEAKPLRRSGMKKQNLAKEDAPYSDTLSVKVVDATPRDLAVKPRRRLGKKKENLIREDAPSADPVSVKVADAINDSNIKRQRRSGKKTTARITKEENMVAGGGTSKTEGDTTSDSEAKPLKQYPKKGEASDLEAKPLKKSGKQGETSRTRGKPLKQSAGKNGDASDSETKPLKQSNKKEDTSNTEDKVSSKKDDGKKRGRGKDTSERDLVKSPVKDDDQDMVSSPKSTSKSVKEEDRVEDPKTNSKRKRTPGKDKVLPSPSDKVSRNVEYGVNLVGSKVKVWWPKDRAFYEGEIASFDPHKKKHKVLYIDGDEEILALQKEKWEFVEDRTMQEADEDSNHDSSAKTHKRKKAKTNSESLVKTNQMDVSPKRAGASSGKLKHKTTKNLAKSDGESDEDLPQAAKKSNDGDGSMSKTIAKSKQETPKTGTKTKGKSPKSGNKSNGTGKGKSSLSKVKGTEDTKGKSSDSAKAPDTSKAQGSETKSGKKRRRGFKG